ncbi:MAG: D-alanine--D-alanine ligase, partial [Lentimicrobium sp.]|nr:D-alanine--D-alanine ligase [Lentimicrobium sp.]
MKKNIALLTGGYSKEYDISVKSGKVISGHLDQQFFNVYLIKVALDRWTYCDDKGIEHEVNLNKFTIDLPTGIVSFDAA